MHALGHLVSLVPLYTPITTDEPHRIRLEIGTENGYGTEDAAIFENGTELNDLGDTQLGEDAPFNEAFDSNAVERVYSRVGVTLP